MNIFELSAKLGIDTSEYDKGLDNAEGKGSKFASGLGKALGGTAKLVAGASVAAVGAAATGITALTTQAVQAYGSYEQLVGGVEKIFGDSADAVMQHASEAFSTAGMSANEYMETVTGFSAALIQNLGGDTTKAAEMADMAIRDMSDNANTFGTDIQSIMVAYQGFSKQNYTMLDNLKLGYGGTKSEVERLIQDAAKLDETFKLQYDDSENLVYGYADVVQAIHIVQEEMNVTGTTAKEASKTIQGTAGSLKSAWNNLIIGLGDANADLKPLIDNVVQSALNMVENIKPVALQAIQGIGTLIEGFAPVLADQIPVMLETILPPLVSAIVTLVNKASEVLPSLIESLLPSVIQAVTSVITSLVVIFPKILLVLSKQLPVILQQLIPAILEILPSVIQAGFMILATLGIALADNADLIMDAIMDIIHLIVDVFLTPENISKFVQIAAKIILTIAEALITNIPEILGAIVVVLANVLQGLAMAFPEVLDIVIGFLGNLVESVGDLLYEGFGDTLLNLWETITGWFDTVKEVVVLGCEAIVGFFADLGTKLIDNVTSLWEKISSFFSDGWNKIVNGIKTFGQNFWDNLTSIWDKAKQIVKDAIEALKNFFKFDWKLPDIKLPHFTVSGEFNLDPTNFSIPKIGVEWYAKAMSTPYLLENASIFGMAGGKLLGGGESGKEIVYGRDQLMSDIATIIDAKLEKIELIAPIYIGGKKIDQQIVTANARNAVVSGGR